MARAAAGATVLKAVLLLLKKSESALATQTKHNPCQTIWTSNFTALTFSPFPCVFCRQSWGAALWKWKATSLGYSTTSRSFLPSVPTLWGEGAPPAGGELSPLGSWEKTDPQICIFRAPRESGQTNTETTSIAMVGPRWHEGRLCGQITNPGWMDSLTLMVWSWKHSPLGLRSSRTLTVAVSSMLLVCSTCQLCQGTVTKWAKGAWKSAGLNLVWYDRQTLGPQEKAAPAPNRGRTAWKGGCYAACSPPPAAQTSQALPCI